MDLQLKGKKAIVTGSTQGIGFAIAESLAKEGSKVVINGRSQESVDKALERLNKNVENADVKGVAADLSDADGTKKLIEAHSEHGHSGKQSEYFRAEGISGNYR